MAILRGGEWAEGDWESRGTPSIMPLASGSANFDEDDLRAFQDERMRDRRRPRRARREPARRDTAGEQRSHHNPRMEKAQWEKSGGVVMRGDLRRTRKWVVVTNGKGSPD
ncbi:hypothetical protein [Goodfellowiella coeruleoviolacea]|uniref:hypothetical protein n=1 Tax=Goodfellowiella coeruleoviolacea TaxID=334858 RepID=UPI0020A5E4A3|nr:hypothetical protein [Goodfellowiella coeruleoviolacea]